MRTSILAILQVALAFSVFGLSLFGGFLTLMIFAFYMDGMGSILVPSIALLIFLAMAAYPASLVLWNLAVATNGRFNQRTLPRIMVAMAIVQFGAGSYGLQAEYPLSDMLPLLLIIGLATMMAAGFSALYFKGQT